MRVKTDVKAGTETAEKIKVMADNGMVIVDPSPELVEGLQAIGAQMLENWKANASDQALSVLEAYQAQ